MKKHLTVLCCCCSFSFLPHNFLHAQDPLANPEIKNTYRSNENPYYWKNRKPYESYWQQDIHYRIKANIDETTDIIEGEEQLTYWNNSPDSLSFVFFHLYQNAFQPGSYLDNLQKNNRVKAAYGKYESKGLGTSVEKITSEEKDLKTELDNTILKVYLGKPLRSGDSVVFNIKFKSYFDAGSTRRRMKMYGSYGWKHYNGVHWYPRICVYDRKFGWETDQHLGREFYGDFGTYDAELTFADYFVMDATGTLLNREEVLPDSLRRKLDLKNFADKKPGTPPSVPIAPGNKRKTWKFHAENVHDFAWTADPTYRIGETLWNGIRCVALAQEPHAMGWQNAAEYTARIIRTYSEDFGMYDYPKMIVADADDGMEYPMLTLDRGNDPGYRFLLAHEVGHNWFFGMVGSNETYRAALDEGFTQFLSVWALDKLEGPYGTTDSALIRSRSSYENSFILERTNRDKHAFFPYLYDAISGSDQPLNTHSDYFNGALGQGGGYRSVYNKTATMLYNLQYVLGDELFENAMKHYVSKWKFCHPYPEDFRSAIIEYTHADLNWFFDQWFETTKSIDYKISSLKKGKAENEYIITFRRKGRMHMPLDFTVFTKDEKAYNFYIPNTWFEKSTQAVILPRWIGWDKLNPVYHANVIIPEEIEDVVIDTSRRLADINMLNNSYKPPIRLVFDSKVYNDPDWTSYEIKARPDLWYNNYDGLKIGFHLNGNYMGYRDIFSLSAWVNTGLVQRKLEPGVQVNKYDNLSFRIAYNTPLDFLAKNLSVSLSARQLDGLQAYTMGLEKQDNSLSNTFYVLLKSMCRPDESSLTYLLYPGEWEAGKYNNTMTIGIRHRYNYRSGTGDINLSLKSSTIASDYSYSALVLSAVNNNSLWRLNIRTRLFAQLGTGNSPAPESALFLAGGNPEELSENKFTRSKAFIDNSWLGYGPTTNHFQMGGGLNLRGYAGYLAVEETKNGDVRNVYRGTSGVSASIEVGLEHLLSIKPKITASWLAASPYLFADAGTINTSKTGEAMALSWIRADAGAGVAITVKKWGPLQTAAPFTIRFDVPAFLSSIPSVDDNYIAFRWVVGINRSF